MAMDVPVSGGTDGTRVASYNPWVGLYWLVSGKTVGGTPIYDQANRFDRMQALRIYSTAADWFSNQEGNKGSIVPGQLADLAVLSEDYFSVPEERIKHLESVLTIVDGKPVYGTAEFSDLSPPPLAVSPDWSPVKYFGGYHNESKISIAAAPSRTTSNTQHQQNWNLSSLSIPDSLSQYWGGLACACCF